MRKNLHPAKKKNPLFSVIFEATTIKRHIFCGEFMKKFDNSIDIKVALTCILFDISE